jgi:hypothetical protein
MAGRKAVILASFVLAAQALVGVVEARSSPAEKASQGAFVGSSAEPWACHL